MNDPISNSILLTMVLIIGLCVLLIAVLAVVAARYLVAILNRIEGGNEQRFDMEHRTFELLRDFNDRDRLHRPTHVGPPADDEVQQPYEAVKPDGMKINACHRGVHDPHTWEASDPWSSKGKKETVWCPGLTQAQSAEADRLAALAEQTYHPDYVPPFGLRKDSMVAQRAHKGETRIDLPFPAGVEPIKLEDQVRETACGRTEEHKPHNGQVGGTGEPVRCPGVSAS